jgi:hypothetical protein
MKRHLSIIILSSTVALGGTSILLAATPALTSRPLASRGGIADPPVSQSRLVALTQSYFIALNDSLATGNFSGLGAIIAPAATLTERSALVHRVPFTQASAVRGRSAILRFYRHLSADFPGGHWIVGIRNQVSPTTMVVYARAASARGTQSLYSSQRVTVRNGKIVSLDLLLDYL